MDADAFCKVFDSLDREIWLITARAGDRQSGLIATYVSRASLVPTAPRVTVGLAKHHFTHELIQESNAFCIHLVDEDHIGWVPRFGICSGREIDKLGALATDAGVTGSPILTGALAWFDFGYLAESYKQWMGRDQPNPAAGINGYDWVNRAIRQRGDDAEMEFAAALITLNSPDNNHRAHVRKAMAGSKTDTLLAQNLASRFGSETIAGILTAQSLGR